MESRNFIVIGKKIILWMVKLLMKMDDKGSMKMESNMEGQNQNFEM